MTQPVKTAIAALAWACGLATPARPADVSVACAVEMTRRDAIAASDYREQRPPGTYWVGHQNQSLGPWTLFDIKRRMHRQELPREVYLYSVEFPDGWKWSTQMPAMDPLPGPATLPADQLAATLKPLLAGCWVSDPFSEAAGEETVWMFLLFDNGVFFPTRGTRARASGEEGFWFLRSSNAAWDATALQGAEFRLALPDITYLDPADDFPARLQDRNTLIISLPGPGPVTFRRM